MIRPRVVIVSRAEWRAIARQARDNDPVVLAYLAARREQVRSLAMARAVAALDVALEERAALTQNDER